MPAPAAFKIDIPHARVEGLKQKLVLTDLPDEVEEKEDPWARGVPLADMKRLLAYWVNDFEWKSAEAELNQLPQFVTEVDVDNFGVHDIHFVHQKSAVEEAVPLLFLHSWPGGFFEVTKILPMLVDGGQGPAFHVVAPSLVDFGFSSASKKKGFSIDQHAEVCHKLMLALGYTEYVVQGGDLGCLTARFIALKYGRTHCKATYLTNVLPAEPTEDEHPELYEKSKSTALTPPELEGLAKTAKFFSTASGYYHIASTRPQTLGYALADSPVALLAWIYEKLHAWTDPQHKWTDEEICTWVSIYWFSTPGPAATSRAFYEFEHRQPKGAFPASQTFIDVPIGVARFARDTVLLPRFWNRTLGPVVYESEYETGGHFAAYERPDAVVTDLKAMFGQEGPLFGCVDGKDGYNQMNVAA